MNKNGFFKCGYNLPPKLTKEETKELIIKMNQGDKTAEEKLLEHNIRLVVYQVQKRFKTVDYDKNELVSIGSIGLLKAIKTFDLSKNNEFATYAAHCIDNEILMFLRKIKKHKHVESTDKVISRDKEGKALKIEDILADDVDIIEEYLNKEAYTAINKIVKALPEREREIIMLHFGFYDGKIYTQQEIAAKFSLSQSYISRLITKIVKKIAIQLESIGIIELNNEGKRKKLQHSEIKSNSKTQTIYQYFYTYSENEIDKALDMLNDEEQELIRKKYSNQYNTLTAEEKLRLSKSIIPRVKRLLVNLRRNATIKEKVKKENAVTVESRKEDTTIIETKPIVETYEPEIEDTITKEDYTKMLELLKSPGFSKLIKQYSAKEIMIFILKLGYVNGKNFSTKAISSFLGINEQEIIDITKKLLSDYKDTINSLLNDSIDTKEGKTLRKNK